MKKTILTLTDEMGNFLVIPINLMWIYISDIRYWIFPFGVYASFIKKYRQSTTDVSGSMLEITSILRDMWMVVKRI